MANRVFYFGLVPVCMALLSACATVPSAGQNKVHVTLLHMNDVYEITPVSGGKAGGLARVAELRRQLLKNNPDTLTLIGGDFFSPSAMGTAKVGGEHLAGKQMVAVMNALGLDYATFGNHEFDIKRDQFYQRMSETEFDWISSNVFDENGHPFKQVVPNKVLEFSNRGGKVFRLGIFGLTLDSNQTSYVSYADAMDVAREQVAKLESKSDFILALTHLAISDDEAIAKQYEGIDLVLGGHEHENYQRWRGDNTPILKADGNARSAYVVDLYFDIDNGETTIEPRLVFIDDSFQDEPKVKKVVDHWVRKAFDAFKVQGLNPEETVATISESLDGLEASVRTESTNLTHLIARSMLRPYKDAELAIFNGGAVRIDDVINPGAITVYDIIRVLPFGGDVMLVEMKGELLIKVLGQGLANSGSGGYLQKANVTYKTGEWQINGNSVSNDAFYKVAILDFLLSGKETGLDYLTPAHEQIKVISEGRGNDIRHLVADELRNR